MNHVVIIGFMGSGKTRVGKQLSKDLGLPFVDLEKIITKRMNLSAREIFERFGEPYYRALETLALKQLIQDSERKVISLGAGLPLQEQNEKYLRELGTVVYLKGSLATLKKRLEGSKKDPMLDGEDRDDKIKKLLKQRDPVYEKFLDLLFFILSSFQCRIVASFQTFDQRCSRSLQIDDRSHTLEIFLVLLLKRQSRTYRDYLPFAVCGQFLDRHSLQRTVKCLSKAFKYLLY